MEYVIAQSTRGPARRWHPGEDALLRRLYADRVPVEEIARRLGRSADAVIARRRSLGIPPRGPGRWSPAHDQLLTAGTLAGLPAPALAQQLGRSPERVRARRRMLVGSAPAGRPYRPEEDEAIRRWIGQGGDLGLLAGRLGRSPDALRLHAQHLGLHRPPPRRRWEEWEDAIVRDGYTSAMPCEEIARQLPGRSTRSVTARARRLKLVSYAGRWSTEDDRRVARLVVLGRTLEEVAQSLGRTPEAIRRRASRLGLPAPVPAAAPRRGRRWVPEEDELLRLHQALNPARLAQLLGRSDGAVCRRLSELGLRARAHRSPHHPGNGRVVALAARRSA